MPQRKLTREERSIARAAMNVVLGHFKQQPTALAAYLQTTRQNVRLWVARGYATAPAALKLDELRLDGARKEQLRPDVADWARVAYDGRSNGHGSDA